MAAFYFPLLYVKPAFEPLVLDFGSISIAKRRWHTSIFDLATLASEHRLHLPYQTMDVFLSRCNSEVCVDAASLADATSRFNSFRLALYVGGVSPFTCPYVATHSLNAYSGINNRDSTIQNKQDLPPELREGLTSATGTVEAWPLELSFQCTIDPKSLALSYSVIESATAFSQAWHSLASQTPTLRAVEEAVTAAPLIFPPDQAVLHLWSAIESLFPSVSTEVTFRISLYLAQLIGVGPDRLSMYNKVRQLYGIRSRIAHGSTRRTSPEEWQQTWNLVMRACEAVMRRGKLPEEKELISELLV